LGAPLGLAWLAALGACTLAPSYQKPATDEVPNWKSTAPFRVSTPQDAAAKGPWWQIYGDAQLSDLEAQALQQSPTLEAAAAHLDQARAQAQVARSALLPQVALNAGASRERISANRPLASYAVPNQSTVQNDFTVGLGVSYEIDLFGANRSALAAAQASAEQAGADLENARLVLTAEVASDYFQLRELDSEIAVVEQSIEAQRHAFDFVKARHDLGDASGLDLAQQQALLDSTSTQVDLLRVRRDQFEHALAVLVGRPAPQFTIDAGSLAPDAPAIPIALPSDVLERRPDVASAERAMAAANAQIGIARAAFFPSIPLVGNYGRESNMVSNLFSAPSLLWSIGVSASESIFNGGRNDANLDFARAGYRATAANYRQTVLVAMQEVEDGLSGLSSLDRAAREAKASVISAHTVLDLANTRYSGGVATYLDVITAQQTVLTNERQATQINGQQLMTSVYLIKALGGSWDSDVPPSASR
jgi:NodT family efflux transporter outer membrane factor (OMF) lipoprotein